MSEVLVLTETGVTGLSYDAVLWLIEHATLEFPGGTLDRLDQGLAGGVVALNASDVEAISAFCDEQLAASGARSPEAAELTAAFKTWSRSDGR
jgi:hypothetical protein